MMNRVHHQLSALMLFSTLLLAASFTLDKPKWVHRQKFPLTLAHPGDSSEEHHYHDDSQWDRRAVMESLLVGAMALGTAAPSASAVMPYQIACLTDLPPVSDDCVRLYLCRHGQTEYNRLRLVQGARVDPPINYNGIQMSLRLGSALWELDEKCPPLILHSKLLRAAETAKNAARNIKDRTTELKPLATLGEVDFGPMVEGKPVSDVRGRMIHTYGAWASGTIDMRPEGGGESGREVSSRQSIL